MLKKKTKSKKEGIYMKKVIKIGVALLVTISALSNTSLLFAESVKGVTETSGNIENMVQSTEETINNESNMNEIEVEVSQTIPDSLQPDINIEETTSGVEEFIETTEAISQEEATPQSSQKIQNYALQTNEIIVYTHTELKTAIENPTNGLTVLYLGANITMESGIAIHKDKANITIDGINPETLQRHILTEMNAFGSSDTFYLLTQPAEPAVINIKNVDVVGYNWYGTITIYDNLVGNTINYDNITYKGPQISYNRSGTVKYKDSTITVDGVNEQEVGEVNRVEYEGTVIMNHYVSRAAFAFSGANAGTYVHANADVTFTTDYGYSSGAVNFTQMDNSKFTMKQAANSGVMITGSGIFSMMPGSEMNLLQNAAASTGQLFSWAGAGTDMILNGATVNITTSGTRSSNIMGLSKATMTDSTININDNAVLSSPAITTSGVLTMNNSKINMILAEDVSTTLGVMTSAEVILVDSEININAKKSIDSRGVTFTRASFTNSKLSIEVAGSVSNTAGTSVLIVITTPVIFTASTMYVRLRGDGGKIYEHAGALNIDENSVFDFYTKTSFHVPLTTSSNLTVSKNGKLLIQMNTSYTSFANSVKVNGNVTFDTDSTVEIYTYLGASDGLILFLGTGRQFVIKNPKHVIMYGGVITPKLVSNASPITYNFEGQQMNQWMAIDTPGNTGNFTKMPEHSYQKANKTNYAFQGTIGGGASGVTAVTSSNFQAGDGSNPATYFSFSVTKVRAFSVGRLNVTLDTPHITGTQVTGTSSPNAAIRFEYKSKGVSKTANGVTDGEGNYTIITESQDQAAFTLTANTPYLYQKIVGSITTPPGELKFLNVPSSLQFGPAKIPTTQTLIPRDDSNWKIDVSDTRTANANWQLYTQVTKSLTPADLTKPVLKDALIFIDENNQKVVLDSNQHLVKKAVETDQVSSVQWSAGQGLLLEINPGEIYSTTTYSGEIQWILQDTP